jgi:hypothetical protein
MFVSANAVQHFFPPARRAGLAGRRAGGVGGAGHHARAARGRRAGGPGDEPAADARSFDSEALWARRGRDWQGRSALIVRGEDGGTGWPTPCAARGAQVGFVAAYRRCGPAARRPQAALLADALARAGRAPVALQQQRGRGPPAPRWHPQGDWSPVGPWPRTRASRRQRARRRLWPGGAGAAHAAGRGSGCSPGPTPTIGAAVTETP